MVFGGEFWVLTVTDQNRTTSGLHPFKDLLPDDNEILDKKNVFFVQMS